MSHPHEGAAFHVVGCSECSRVWVLETDISTESADCPGCGSTHQRDSLRSLASADSEGEIRELRSRIIAVRSGNEDAIDSLDDYGVLEDQVEDYFERRDQQMDDAVAGGGDLDLHPIESERYASQAESYLDAQTERYASQAEATLGLFDDAWGDVESTHEFLDGSGSGPEAVNARTGTLALDDQVPADADASLALDASVTASGLWANLFQEPAMHDAFVNGCRRFAAGRTASELGDALQRYGVSHILRGAIQHLARADSRDDAEAMRAAVYGDEHTDGACFLARRLGTQRADLNAMLGTARLIGWADAGDVSTPTITARLTDEFRERPREQREAVLDLLCALSRHSDVVVVASPIDLRWLAVDHDLERGSFSERWTGRCTETAIDDRTDEALDELDRDSSAIELLRHLHDTTGERLSYAELSDRLDVSTPRISQLITSSETSLTELGLVDTIDADGQTVVELLPAGRQTIEVVDADIGRQHDLDGWADDEFSEPLNSSDHGRVIPREDEGGDGGDPRRKGEGLAPVGTLTSAEAAGAVASAEPGGIATVDTPVAKADDYRCSKVWVDPGGGRVVSSAEYVNPMQYWVSIARSLTHWRVFEYALTDERLASADHEFGGLFDEHRQLLRSSRCLGHLADEGEGGPEEVGDYADELQEARDHLEQMTGRLADEDFEDESRFRGEILREAHGLVGTMAHLFDLCDVDLVRELRLPSFSSDFDADRWEDLTKTIAMGAAIQSRYGHFAAYRQLFEDREEKLKWATFADVDADDTVGEMIGSMVLVGNFGARDGEKRAAFVDDLRDALGSPGKVRDDAPEFEIEVPVRAFEFDREHFATAAARIASRKELRPTRDAVSLLSLFAATPYAVATCLNWLDGEGIEREIRVSEVRFALSKLSPDSLLPQCRPGARRLVAALLAAEKPLSTGELTSEDHAGVDRATLSRSDNSAPGDRLQALGLLERTEEGWRLPLSFRDDDERYENVVPTLVENASSLFVRDVLFEVAEDLIDDTSRWFDPDDPVCGCWRSLTDSGIPDCSPVLEEWPWLWDWIDVLERVLEERAASVRSDEEPTTSTATFGRQASQQSIQRAA